MAGLLLQLNSYSRGVTKETASFERQLKAEVWWSMRLLAIALPASLPRLSIKWRSTISLLFDKLLRNMKNAIRTKFHNFFATTGGLGSTSICIIG